jgi:hypothetical protein
MVARPRWGSSGVGRWSMFAVLAAGAVSLAFLAATTARASGGPASIAAGPAFGFVPSRNAQNVRPHGHVAQLQYHGGPVQTSAANHNVYPIFWGSAWSSGSFSSTESGIATTFYGGLGGSSYANTNTEYKDGSGNYVTSGATANGATNDTSAAPSNAPSTSQVLAEVAKKYPNPSAGAYYPVYSDQPRGTAGYCAWHSTGMIGNTRVQFAFFFSLSNDPGCSPDYPNASPQLEALGNVSGHEWSEMETDPQLNAWYDQQGNENADKCAWQFNGTQHFTSNNSTWTIQGNWSNAASGCIWGT